MVGGCFERGGKMSELTAIDVLNIVEERAQWCRENGECDMRDIVHLTQSIKRDVETGKSRSDIMKEWAED